MKSILLPAAMSTTPVRGLPLVFVGIAFSGILLLSGCGRSEEKPADATQESPTPSAIADAPQETPTPAASPSPATSPTPGASPQPSAIQSTAIPPKTLFVVTAFEAVSELGTHQFPVGTQVNVMEVDGDDYLVEYNGIAVRNGREFFSETLVADSVAAEPVPPATTPTPEATPTLDASPTPEEQAWPAATGTPDPQLDAEEEKSAELLGKIRSINQEIRQAEDAQKMETNPDAEVEDSSEIKNLKKRRDALSEDLTDFAKP